jgi:N-acyl-D-aspartate/D-glutamate deacylase
MACWIVVSVAVSAHSSHSSPTPSYDTVILHGRVIDPESGADAVRNVGIIGGSIAAITTDDLEGRNRVEASGLVVAPGFIDLHNHAQDPHHYAVAATAGVTTTLELERGTDDVERWYADRADTALVNYGVSVGHMGVRMAVMRDSGREVAVGDAAHRPATDSELSAIRIRLSDNVRRGALAIGFVIGMTPAATRAEIMAVFQTAAELGVMCYVHMRSAPSGQELSDLEEVLAAAAVSGARLHIAHIQASAREFTSSYLRLIAAARSRGMDVSTETYPYVEGMTNIESALLDGEAVQSPAFLQRLEWPSNGERLTPESFARYRKQGGLVIVHPSDPAAAERWVRTAVAHPLPLFASDGGVGRPRGTGTFARVLGHHVRELQDLTLMDALRRMTLEPARLLERRVPAFRRKGRVQVGADADLVVFDPERVLDRATIREPTLAPEGIPYVFVAGVAVVNGGTLSRNTAPGMPVRAQALP